MLGRDLFHAHRCTDNPECMPIGPRVPLRVALTSACADDRSEEAVDEAAVDTSSRIRFDVIVHPQLQPKDASDTGGEGRRPCFA